jgi:hypothetical protein
VTDTRQAIPLQDLSTARVVCARDRCGGAFELPIRDLGRVAAAQCPRCGRDLYTEYGPESPFAQLGRAIQLVQSVAARVGIEFVVPVRRPDAADGN